MAQRRTTPSRAQIKNRQKAPYGKIAKLNIRAVTPFKYDLREILADSQLDEQHEATFIANLITKASRISLIEAKDYVESVAEEGKLSKETAGRICRLLDRFKKYR